jgi:hypothetical protein
MTMKSKCLAAIVLVSILDVLPIPVMGLIAFFIVLTTPRWFLRAVKKLYQEQAKVDAAPVRPTGETTP